MKQGNAVVAALVGGVAGATIVWIFSAIRPIATGILSVQAGDWLQSVSTIIGVAFTIWATLWLEERKRIKQRGDEQRLLREALLLFRAQLETIQGGMNADDPLGNRVTQTAGHYELIRNSKTSLAYARESFRIRSFNLWSAMNALDQDFAFAADRLAREEAIIRDRNVTEAVLAISRERIEAFALEVTTPVNAAIEALKTEGA